MKLKILICVIAALFAFSGSSPWEGAAAVAPAGELPAAGRYVATNSFPANTIVDITNIENNRSTRAIVAGSLNSPGLLAIVSREAAELIGMRPGSVSRIRMVQPSDPIAYMRFTEGVNADIPGFDSGSVITEQDLLNEVYRGDTYRPPSSDTQTAQADGTRGPSYILEPEWSGRRIIDLPGYVEYPPLERVPETVQTPAAETPSVVQIPEQRPAVETPAAGEQSQREVIKDIAEKIDETPNGEVIKNIPEYIAEVPRSEADKDIPGYIAEIPRDEAEKDIPEYLIEEPRADVAKDIPERTSAPDGQTEYVMVPTPERPPENSIYGIDPSDIIPDVAIAPPVREPVRPADPVVTDTSFSIPRIFSLDRGWYYVQIAAVDSPDLVESTVRQIDRSYQPKVYKDGDNWYRILLGPMNQGESAAVLQRFKSIGYKDAFVRRGS